MKWLRCVPLLVVLLWCSAAEAMTVRATGAKVFVNETLVIEYRVAESKLRPDQRASQTAALLEKSDLKAAITIRTRGDRRQILIGKRVVIDLGPPDARAAETSLPDLAQQTSDRLDRARKAPPLAFTFQTIVLPVGRPVSLSLVGSKVRKAVAVIPEGSGLTVTMTPDGPTVTASRVGSFELVVRDGSALAKVTLSVLPYAAVIPPTLAVDVAGDPASAKTVEAALTRAVELGSSKVPGAKLEYDLAKVGPVPRGQSQTIPVQVRATAQGAFERSAVMNVRVRNLGNLFEPEEELWYCNDPENVKGYQTLFMAELNRAKPARLLYHHLNAMGRPMSILVGVANPSDQPAQLFLNLGDGEPDLNPVLVGYQAADRFWMNYVEESGVVLTIPPQTWIPIAARTITSNVTMSGLGYLRLLPGGPEKLQAKAFSAYPGTLDPAIATGAQRGLPWAFTTPKALNTTFDKFVPDPVHIYPNPFRIENARFEVGGRFLFVRIGERAIPSQMPEKFLSGNFGVHYTVKVDLVNPSLVPATIEVVFVASAGYSGGLFNVNGQAIKTRLLQPQGEERICRVRLEPGETRQVTVETIPLSGSSYPATIAVRPVDSMRNGGTR